MLLWELLIGCFIISSCMCWQLTIVHTNDMHAWFDEESSHIGICHDHDQCVGGFARVKFFADWAKKTYENVLFLNAGDNFQGTTYYSLYKWKVVANFIDRMGIDVMTLGNHEFDDGVSSLVPYLKQIKTPWVVCNIQTENEPLFKDIIIKPWQFINIQGKSVAVIGYLTPETKFLSTIGNLTILDEVDSLRRAVKQVKELGADIVIGLGHSGWDKDLEIAQQVQGLNLVVGGHSHTFHYTGTPVDKSDVPVSVYPHMVLQTLTMPEPSQVSSNEKSNFRVNSTFNKSSTHIDFEDGEPEPSEVSTRGSLTNDFNRNKTIKWIPVVQASAYTKYVGLLNLTFDDNNQLISAEGNPVLMDQVIPQDKMILKLLKPWKDKSKYLIAEKIGVITSSLDSEQCRIKECNFGNLVTDAMVDYRKREFKGGNGWTDAPVALLNSGYIRASINNDHNGSVTLGDLLTGVPIDDVLVKITVNSSVFRDIVEYSVHRYDTSGAEPGGEFLQYSGVQVAYDVRRQSGKRIKSLKVRCGTCDRPSYEELKPESNITFLTTGFTANGGDGFTMMSLGHRESIGDTSCFDVIKTFIRNNSPVNAQVEGRIAIIR